ncbi:MAG: hypothetical protein ACP5NV_05930 [Candidatus Woesearchaeota archaeon]
MNSFEFQRKTLHIVLGLILVTLIYYNFLQSWIMLIILILGILISYLSIKRNIPIIEWFLLKFDRKEHKTFPGRGVVSIIFASTILLMLKESMLLDKNIVLASLMIWTFGDSLSAIIGTSYNGRKHPLNNKRFIEGTLAGMIGGALAAWLFVPAIVAAITSIIAIGLESLEFKILKHPIDDNILVPLISAIVMSILITIL